MGDSPIIFVMKNSPFSLLTGPVIAIIIFASVITCDAQTFRIDGPKNYNFTSAHTMSIILKNRTASNQQVYVRIENNTENQIEFTPSVINLPDSNLGPGAEVVLMYSPHGPSIINAQIIFFDSVATRDTVFINGKDTLFHDAAQPYRIYSLDNKEIRGGTGDTTRYVYFTHGIGGREFPMRLKNYRASPIEMTLSYIGLANGFSVSPSMLTLNAYPSSAMSIDIKASYTQTGNQYDTGMLVIKSTDVSVPQDTLVFIGRDTGVVSPTSMKGDTVDLGITVISVPVVYDIVIRNTTLTTVTLNNVVVGGNANKSFVSPFKSFTGLILAPGDSTVYTLIYNSPSRKEIYSNISFTISMTTSKGETGFLYYLFTAHTESCYPQKPSGSLLMESAIPGGYTEASFSFRNNNETVVMLKEITPGIGTHPEYFTLTSPALPLWFNPWEETELRFRFSPTDTVTGMAYAPLNFAFDIYSFDTACLTMEYALYSSTISADDSSVIPLYPNQTASLPMASTADTLTKRFTFINNLAVPVKVMSVAVTDAGHFTITSTSPSPLPVELASNDLLTIDVLFDAGANGYYTDDLVIVTEHSLTSQTFHLKALRTNGLPEAVGRAPEVQPFLSIFPNPSTGGVVTCSASAGTKKIAIFDALGNLVSQKDHLAQWEWMALNSDNKPISSGVYFVRAEGVSENGKPFVISKKLILE
jgi:hypothetical protein